MSIIPAIPSFTQKQGQYLAFIYAYTVIMRRPPAEADFQRYFDDRGYLQCFVRWGANDGPDDAFENTTGWPELHALGAGDEILQLHLRAWEGMIRQFTEARTTDVPIGRQGMYYKDFSVQSDWMHHG